MIPVLILFSIACSALLWLHVHRLQRDRVWWSAWLVPVFALVIIGILIATDLSLQKVLGRLLMPAGLVWMALLAASGLSFIRRHWIHGLIALCLTTLYTLSGNIWLGNTLAASLEVMVKPVDPATCEAFDAVAVLGGGTDIDAHGRPQLGNSGARVALAVRLFYAGKTPVLISTGLGLEGTGRNFSEETRQLWMGLGVPDTSIVMLAKGRITREEIHELKKFCAEHGYQRVGLISSAWHMPRVLLHCGNEGFSVTPLPCDWRGTQDQVSFLNLIPHADGFQKVHLACWEWLGRWVGR